MFPTPRRRKAALFLCCLAAAALAAACDGSNAWTPTGPGGPGNSGGGGTPSSADTTRPTVVLEQPDSNANVAVGDSLFVQAHVTDNLALDSVQLRAFQVLGSPVLGTDTTLARFTTKTIHLAGGTAVKDTTLKRFLLPTGDSSRVSAIRVVATAWDTAGNSRADTTLVNIGGPRVQILSPPSGASFNAGTQFSVAVLAQDSSQLVHTVRLLGSGAFTFDTTLTFTPSVPRAVDTVQVLIPAKVNGVDVQGAEDVHAVVTAASGAQGVSAPVTLTIHPSGQDVLAPAVSFTATVPATVEVDDSFSVSLQATDETRVDSLGVTVLAIHPRAGGEDTLHVFASHRQASADVETFSLSQIPANLLSGLDTLHLRLEVTAWAKDPFANCATAVSPGTPQRNACTVKNGVRFSTVSGYIYNVLVVRGTTVPPIGSGDVLADLVADSQRVYLSNFSRNEVDVLPLGGTVYSTVRVGSQPWGLAIGRARDTLYVANSGGTNISVVPLNTPTLAEAQDKRIFTQNELLFSVTFDPTTLETSTVTSNDYSDRPQFIAQASNGLLVYSTEPTKAAADGTVRIFDPRKTRSEIFTGYVDRHTAGQAIVVNADSSFLVAGTPKQLMVCPRRRFGDAADPPCIVGNPVSVSDSLTRMRAAPANAAGGRWDTRVDIGADIAQVGLSDTTFVAVSGDRNYVAVGEGARQNARIPLFTAPAGGDSLLLVGDVHDLISNTAERVIGLSLNYDGSLGVARGDQAYYFNNQLRLQGVVAAGAPTGGVAMHPGNAGYPNGSNRYSFVSGIDAVGPYVDVIDNFNFFRVKRLYTRDPVVGAMAVAPRAPTDAPAVTLRIYALTSRGVLSLPVTAADLTP